MSSFKLGEIIIFKNAVTVAVIKAEHAADLPLPRYMTDGSAGMDLYAAVETKIEIKPGERALIPTGLHMAIPVGYELQVRPRSGLAINQGIGVLNSPGTIDPDYRGEIKIILINMGQEPYAVMRGDRVAQAVLCPVIQARFELTEQLPPSGRNEGGFGHTG